MKSFKWCMSPGEALASHGADRITPPHKFRSATIVCKGAFCLEWGSAFPGGAFASRGADRITPPHVLCLVALQVGVGAFCLEWGSAFPGGALASGCAGRVTPPPSLVAVVVGVRSATM